MSYIYWRAQNATEVDALLSAHGSAASILAGGTDLLVQVRDRTTNPRYVVDISDLSELSNIETNGKGMRIGAACPLWRVIETAMVRERFAALREAARCVGSVQIQNRATVVGNICNASPAADTAPALLIYDAVVGVRSSRGRRRIPLSEFWLGPRRTGLDVGEWVEYVEVRDAGHHGSCYIKLGRTRGIDLALVGVAVLAAGDGFRLAYAAVAPTVRRAIVTESLLDPSRGADQIWESVARSLATEIDPIDDVRASAQYRSSMALVCTKRGIATAHRRLLERGDASG